MSKVIKQMELDDLHRTFKDVRDLVVLTVDRLTCQGDYTLRANLRKKNIRLKVVKNSLCRKVFKELNIQVPDESPFWEKNTMLAWGTPSISELSRAVEGELKSPKTSGLYRDKERERVIVKGAIADGQTVPFDLALKMPTREELIAQILSAILSPASAIAGCLVGPISTVAGQIQQISEKKDEEAPASAETPAAVS